MLFALVLTLGLTAVVAAAALGWRILQVLFVERPARPSGEWPLRVCVVLGSGGHTSEMFAAIMASPHSRWLSHRPFYVVAETDKDSGAVAKAFEASNRRHAHVIVVPRAREVGQSYVTSVFSTLRALWRCFSIALRERPDVILTNGPGVCIPVVGASMLLAALKVVPRPRVSYFESFTCVEHLSLSGRLMLPVADVFTIQWPQMRRVVGRHRRAVRYTGPFAEDSAGAGEPVDVVDGSERELLKPDAARAVALVTVGSTCFDELVAAVDCTLFMDALCRMGIRRLLVQRGRSTRALVTPPPPELDVEVFDYRRGLARIIRDAALVISHAGAGTILEALGARVRTVVVPNARLMSNHQLQLARALAERHHLFYVLPENLANTIEKLDWSQLAVFPKPSPAVAAALSDLLP